MKNAMIYLFYFIAVMGIAQENEFTKNMQQGLKQLENAKTFSEVINASNNFQRIAVSTDEWLAYYYSAYTLITANYNVDDEKEKDNLINKAETLLNKAEEIYKSKNNETDVELVLLRSYLIQARYSVAPQSRANKLAPVAEQLLEVAKEMDPQNPRYYYLKGESIFFTPKMFGGGKKKAMPLLEEAMNKYQSYKPKSILHPNWGKDRCEKLLAECL